MKYFLSTAFFIGLVALPALPVEAKALTIGLFSNACTENDEGLGFGVGGPHVSSFAEAQAQQLGKLKTNHPHAHIMVRKRSVHGTPVAIMRYGDEKGCRHVDFVYVRDGMIFSGGRVSLKGNERASIAWVWEEVRKAMQK